MKKIKLSTKKKSGNYNPFYDGVNNNIFPEPLTEDEMKEMGFTTGEYKEDDNGYYAWVYSRDSGHVDVDYLLDSGYTEIPKSKIDSVIKDLEEERPYIEYRVNKCDVVIFPFVDRDNNGVYLNEDLKLFFSHRKNTISISDVKNKIHTLIK